MVLWRPEAIDCRFLYMLHHVFLWETIQTCITMVTYVYPYYNHVQYICNSFSDAYLYTLLFGCKAHTLSRNCYPVPALVLRKHIFLIVSLSGGLFFSQTLVGGLAAVARVGARIHGAASATLPKRQDALYTFLYIGRGFAGKRHRSFDEHGGLFTDKAPTTMWEG